MNNISSKQWCEALDFLEDYAKKNLYFTGGDVLAAYRATGTKTSQLNWRNTWGALVTNGAKQGWYGKVGRKAPTSSQSHTSTLVLWRSRLYKGPDFGGSTSQEQLHEIRKQVVTREMDLIEGLWKAFELGCEIGGNK